MVELRVVDKHVIFASHSISLGTMNYEDFTNLVETHSTLWWNMGSVVSSVPVETPEGTVYVPQSVAPYMLVYEDQDLTAVTTTLDSLGLSYTVHSIAPSSTIRDAIGSVDGQYWTRTEYLNYLKEKGLI